MSSQQRAESFVRDNIFLSTICPSKISLFIWTNKTLCNDCGRRTWSANLQTIGQHSNSRHSESKPIYFAVNERAITSIRLGGTTKVRFGRYIGNVLKPFFNLRQSRSWQISNWHPNKYASPSTTNNFFTIVSWCAARVLNLFYYLAMLSI